MARVQFQCLLDEFHHGIFFVLFLINEGNLEEGVGRSMLVPVLFQDFREFGMGGDRVFIQRNDVAGEFRGLGHVIFSGVPFHQGR